jgi:hypothetical protein
MNRDDAARAFAEAMPKWRRPDWLEDGQPWSGFLAPNPCPPACGVCQRDIFIELPTPDAPLHEHLQFAGRVIHALSGLREDGCECEFAIESPLLERPNDPAQVTLWDEFTGEAHVGKASDLSWAAMRAALAARGKGDR